MLSSLPRRMLLLLLISGMERFVRTLLFSQLSLVLLPSFLLIFSTWFDAVWRHVLGTNDAIDGVDIALGKCRNHLHYMRCSTISGCIPNVLKNRSRRHSKSGLKEMIFQTDILKLGVGVRKIGLDGRLNINIE